MTDAGPIIIIGGGHNGLVCAAYLARAGRRVLVLEAADTLGGAAITREFHPGFKVSAVAHLLHLLDPVVIADLKLAGHGLAFAGGPVHTIALAGEADALELNAGEFVSGNLSANDRAALASYTERMRRFAALLARQHSRTPARIASGDWHEAMAAAKFGLDIRRLGRKDMREFLRVATMCIFDVLEETFDDPLLKGALAFDAVIGTKLGPRSGGTVFASLHRASGAVDGRPGTYAIPRGGVGAVTQSLAAAVRSAGAEIRVASPVAAITMDGDHVSGVRLASGEELAAGTVVSNADPKTTLLGLLGARHLETEFARRVHNLRATGTAAKLHLALSALPEFRGVPAASLGHRLVIAGDMEYLERAFNPAKYREYSAEPAIEITIPTVRDPSLAPPDQHVLSAVVQYAPYDLASGWDASREKYRELTLDVLERYAPGIRRLVVGAELLTPVDIERQFRITGGHWHHAELALDQIMMLRPVPGGAQYAMPVTGLYLCGAGCHPGGGVMGTAGRNAARTVLEAK